MKELNITNEDGFLYAMIDHKVLYNQHGGMYTLKKTNECIRIYISSLGREVEYEGYNLVNEYTFYTEDPTKQAKKMTVAEITEQLGYNIEIVKG